MLKIIMVRHAHTDAIGNYFAGRASGVSLNKEGQLQVQKLTERMAVFKVDGIYSSPLERAIETAEPLARLFNKTIMKSDELTEIDGGNWTRLSFEELKKDHQFYLFNAFRSATRIPGGELMLEAQLRIVLFIEKLRLQHNDQTIILVSHADVIKAGLAYFAGIPLDFMQRFEISPASVSIIEIYEETSRIIQINETAFINKK